VSKWKMANVSVWLDPGEDGVCESADAETLSIVRTRLTSGLHWMVVTRK